MILEQIAALLNRNVEHSSRAQALASRLEGRSLGVYIEGLNLNVQARIEEQRFTLATGEVATGVDATLSGTPLALLSLLGAAPQSGFKSRGVTISGDAEVAQTFHDLLRAARPEIEEELSRLVGDVAAHQIGNALRGLADFGRKTAETMATNVAEYLQEESRDLATRTEIEEFLSDVDQVREATDRLAARVEHLERASS